MHPKRVPSVAKGAHFSRAIQRASIIEAENCISPFEEMFAQGPRLTNNTRVIRRDKRYVRVTCFRLGTRNDDCSRRVRAWDARRRLNVFVEGDHSGSIHAAPSQHHGADLSHPRIQEHLTLSPNQANRRARVTAHRIAGAAPLPN